MRRLLLLTPTALVLTSACKLFDKDATDAGAPPPPTTTAPVASSAPSTSASVAVVEPAPTATTPVTSAGHITSLTAGGDMTCAISDGKVICWGRPPRKSDGKPWRIAGIDNAVSVALGGHNTCAVLSDGTVKCWEKWAAGTIAETTIQPAPRVPTTMPGITNAKAIAASLFHTCVLTSSGGISCWGDNERGQLGTCTNKSSTTPVAAKNVADATAVFASEGHTCALVPGDASERSLVCWGSYSWSQRSNFDATDPCPRVMMPASSVSVATSHACAVSSGDVWCWGGNNYGQAGITSDIPQTKPTKVMAGAIGVAAGYGHTCALLNGGTVRCWGGGWAGQLGDGVIHASNPNEYVTAEQSKPIAGLTDVVTITAGSEHTCALTRAGRIFCWGDASAGQMGDGRGEDGFAPPPIHQPTPIEVVGPF